MFSIIAFLVFVGSVSSVDTSNINRQQIYCMATAVYHEARGEDITGQSAVSHVILNRVYSERYPDTPCEVVYQPYQFSYIKHATPDYNSTEWKNAVESAVFAVSGITDDPTNGAMYYYAHDLVNPHWSSAGIVTASIGGHTFLTIPR